MISLPTEEPQRVADVLGYLRVKRISVWVEDGRMHYRAPKGTLGPSELNDLKSSEDHIMKLLARNSRVHDSSCRVAVSHAPLAFSQLAHWNVYRLAERYSMRQIASAIRIRGDFRAAVLEDSIRRVLRRHDALRTKILCVDGVPIQEIMDTESFQLETTDLTEMVRGHQGHRIEQVSDIIDDFVLRRVDVFKDPLFAARLLKVGASECVLLIAMEHMISDAYSLGVVIRDVFAEYVCRVNGEPCSLPEVCIQFPDYAARQRHSLSGWLELHTTYWRDRLSGFQRPKIPGEQERGNEFGWGTTTILISKQLKRELVEWSRIQKTTLVMTVLTAYIALVMRWCGTSQTIIQYQTDGRYEKSTENSVGFFASVLYLRIVLNKGDSFQDLLAEVMSEYSDACLHADQSFFESSVPRPEFSKTFWFNWVPHCQRIDVSALQSTDRAIECSPLEFDHPMLRVTDRDNDPLMLLYEREDDVVGGIHYPRNRFEEDLMGSVGRNFIVFLRELLANPGARISSLTVTP